MVIRNIFKVKKTGKIFRTNYVDYHNCKISMGDYRKSTKLIDFNEVEEVTTKDMTVKESKHLPL